MIKTVVFVPKRDNSGRRFAGRFWRELEDRLLTFGGLSRLGDSLGVWRGERGMYRDQSHVYVVALSTWAALPAWLDQVRWIQQRFGQEAMYIEVAGIPEILDLR